MAIDRTNYNALVDDNGTNTTGTIWSKNQVKICLLDPIDTLVGEWATVPFNAANFTGNGAMTWTVISANQVQFRWMKINKLLWVQVELTATTVAGTPNTTLRIAAPATLATVAAPVGRIGYCTDNGTVRDSGLVGADAGFGLIDLTLSSGANWTASTTNTSIYFQGFFELA